jgi:hypothetical protein
MILIPVFPGGEFRAKFPAQVIQPALVNGKPA